MKAKPLSNPHWTDEELIASLYGVGPEDGHLDRCAKCKLRQDVLVDARRMHEAVQTNGEGLRSEFLSAQRRAVYEKLEARESWKVGLAWRRWAPAALALLILVSGAAVYERHHALSMAESQLSDTQLALELSRMSQDSQSESTAPLQGLFE
jgi:hypothetical protein